MLSQAKLPEHEFVSLNKVYPSVLSSCSGRRSSLKPAGCEVCVLRSGVCVCVRSDDVSEQQCDGNTRKLKTALVSVAEALMNQTPVLQEE